MYAGVLAALLELDLEVIRQLLTESYAKKPALVEANMKAVQLGYDYAKQHLPCRCRCECSAWTRRKATS